MSAPNVPPVPAVLRLVQSAVLGRWRATGEDLYREVARLAEITAGQDVLVAGCGPGLAAEWLAARTGASVTGVDPDPESIERAESHARALDPTLPLTYQHAPLDDLPHEDAVFDIAIGEPALSSAADPARAVAELARVTRPLGTIVLLQPTWTTDVPVDSRQPIVERLGLRPYFLVEWKQMMRAAGVVELQVQDWATRTPSRPTTRPSGTVEIQPAQLTWRQKMQIVGRAWRGRGWREARTAVARETELIRELSRERTIGFQLITGVKWPHPVTV